MQIRVVLAPWLPFVLECFAQLCEIGFDLDETDIDLIIQDAVEMEID
jgi:hypothetical protein